MTDAFGDGALDDRTFGASVGGSGGTGGTVGADTGATGDPDDTTPRRPHGVAPEELDEADLFRELDQLGATRIETLRHGSSDALDAHTRRFAELEAEYLRRFPHREVDPERLRSGARARTGADGPTA